MKSRGQVAAAVARQKQQHPEFYCPEPRCLWRTGGGYCPRHRGAPGGLARKHKPHDGMCDLSDPICRAHIDAQE